MSYTDEEKAAFAREVANQQRSARQFDYLLECPHCRFTMRQSQARAQGLSRCPQCGGAEVRVKTLDYNGRVPENPLPSVQEAEQFSRQQRPGSPR